MLRDRIPKVPPPRKGPSNTIWVILGLFPLIWSFALPYAIEMIANIVSMGLSAIVLILIITAIVKSKKTRTPSRRRLSPLVVLGILVVIFVPAGTIITVAILSGNLPSTPDAPAEIADSFAVPPYPTSSKALWYRQTEIMKPGSAQSKRALFPDFGAPFAPVIEFNDEGDTSSSYVGTANALDSGRVWLTARHVAAGCEAVYIYTDRRRMSMADRVYLHPTADVALVIIDSPSKIREPLYLSPEPGKARKAFAMGFPWGSPGGWSGNYMGQARAIHRGVHTGSEQVTVWSEASRIPHEKPHMGGISGGAVFDDTGNMIGIAIGGNPRRGRHDVSTLATIEPFLQDRDVVSPQTRTSAQSPYAITAHNYPVFIKSHIRNNRIAKVLCHNG